MGHFNGKTQEKERYADEGQRERSPAPVLPPIQSKLHTQRAKGITLLGKHTGTHTSRYSLPRPRGRKLTQAQITQMQGNLIYTVPHTPLPLLKLLLKVLNKSPQCWVVRKTSEFTTYIRTKKFRSFFNHPVANYFQKSYFQFKYQYVQPP